MAAKAKVDDLCVLGVDFRDGTDLHLAGELYPRTHRLVRLRPELFCPLAEGQPGIDRVKAELDRANTEEAREAGDGRR